MSKSVLSGLLSLLTSRPAFPLPETKTDKSAFDFSFTAITGAAMPLSPYRGKVLLVVNTASRCGFTPQYAGLEKLARQYRDKGLVVIGVPSNDFGNQEPGSNEEIQEFCANQFQTTFPLTAKEPVLGERGHPFYRWIAAQFGEAKLPGWNFCKYLVSRDGRLRGVFPSRVAPDSEKLISALESELARA